VTRSKSPNLIQAQQLEATNSCKPPVLWGTIVWITGGNAMYGEKTAVGRLAGVAALVLTIAFLFTMLTQPAQAQSFSVIHTFLGGVDGNEPAYGMAIDGAGNLLGSTFEGDEGTGTIFRVRHLSSGWQLLTIYVFIGGPDSPGAVPYAGVVVGPNGSLYGTTAFGGVGPCTTWGGTTGCGTVFNLRPPLSVCITALCYWTETPLAQFNGSSGGAVPTGAQPIFDRAGNLYGTTFSGGGGSCSAGCGVVYELVPSGSGWTEQVLYSFTGAGGDGASPWAGLVFDQAGNLYGTTEFGGAYGYGTIYELSPSGSGWTEKVLYSFQNQADGGNPYAGLIFDRAGNLYGATTSGGTGNGGTVFELTPSGSSWNYQTLSAFVRRPGELAGGPTASLIMDAAGNLYGATAGDGAYGLGSVFKVTPSGGGWTTTTLYDFTGASDGELPRSNLVMDTSGDLYGTATGGADGYGVLFEITP
jgi:uncharacterized repeat protein (TIGR03803 family)